MRNFNLLQAEYAELIPEARRVEEPALSDPRGSYFYARLPLEHAAPGDGPLKVYMPIPIN
jgi:hypothetical protein